MEKADPTSEIFECRECGLHYVDAGTAQKCAEWCLKYSSCNLEITSLSVERINDI